MMRLDNYGLFLCDPDKHATCMKTMCFMHGGPCQYTGHKQYERDVSSMTELETMLKMQSDFQVRLDPHLYEKNMQERVAFIKEHSIHLNQEINEMLYELPFFKPWKDYSNMSIEEQRQAFSKARMECIDAWHFFMNIMIGLGFTAEEFFEMYMAKNKENHRRQDAGYTHDVSYQQQSIEEVMHNG